MKVIFLDFDVVINNWDNFNGVDFKNVERLLKIINVTGAKIVATTSNKYDFQVHLMNFEDTNYFRYVYNCEV